LTDKIVTSRDCARYAVALITLSGNSTESEWESLYDEAVADVGEYALVATLAGLAGGLAAVADDDTGTLLPFLGLAVNTLEPMETGEGS